MLDKKEFDLWADGYDKTVGISDEENTYPFAGYRKVLGFILLSSTFPHKIILTVFIIILLHI